MKNEDILNVVGDIDEAIIENVSRTRKKPEKKKKTWVKIVAVAACMCLLVTGIYSGGFFDKISDITLKAGAIERAVYPEMKQYPKAINDLTFSLFQNQYNEWQNDVSERKMLINGYERSLDDFVSSTSPVFLGDDSMKGENAVYSPVNLYLALSLLAESTGSGSREQILSLLSQNDIESLRKQAGAVANSSYRDDGSAKTLLSNSVWLGENLEYNRETLKLLSENYYASSFSGKMGSDNYNKLLQEWLSEQTGGLLDEEAKSQKFDENTILGLASTVYFAGKWSEKFSQGENTDGIFHGADGDENAVFMNERVDGHYYYSEKFAACEKYFENEAGNMWFILPDEGVSVYDLLSDEAALDLISGKKQPDSKFLFINFSAPKFDVSSSLDLRDGLKSLGVTDIFNSEKADFSPMLETEDAYISKIDHAARVKIDEEGCEAAAFTVMIGCGAAMPPEEEVDFVLDRPFIFVINGGNNLPLFVGIVNNVG